MNNYVNEFKELKIAVEPKENISTSDLREKIEEKIVALRKSKNSTRVRQSPAKANAIDAQIKSWSRIKEDEATVSRMLGDYEFYRQTMLTELNNEIKYKVWSPETIAKHSLEKLAKEYNVSEDYILKKHNITVEEIDLLLLKIKGFPIENDQIPYFEDIEEVEDIGENKDYRRYSQNIGKNLEILGMRNIYEFLGNTGKHSSSIENIREKDSGALISIAEKLRDGIYKESTEGKNIVNALTSPDGILSSTENRRKYDQYLDNEIVQQLEILKRIEGIAIDAEKGNRKYIFDSQIQPLLTQLKNIFINHGLSEMAAGKKAKSMVYKRIQDRKIVWILPWVYCVEAKRRVESNDLDAALLCIEVAEAAHINNGMLAEAKKAVSEYQKNTVNLRKRIMVCIEAKRFLEASLLLKKNPSCVDIEVKNRIGKVIQKIHQIQNSLNLVSDNEDKVFNAVKQMEEMCSDYDGTQILNHFPPEQAENIIADLADDTVRVRWDYFGRTENIQFVVVKSMQEIADDLRRCQVIGKTDKMVFEDRSPAHINYYGVYVVRGEAKSSINSIRQPIVYLQPVKDIKIIKSDGMVKVEWGLKGNGEVRVRKKEPAISLRETLLPKVTGNVLIDTDVENEHTYVYSFTVEDIVDGIKYASKSKYLTITPDIELPPVHSWNINRDYALPGNKFIVSWKADKRGEIYIFTVNSSNTVYKGQRIDYQSFSEKYARLKLEKKMADNAILELEPDRENIYLVIGLLRNNTLVLSDVKSVSTVEKTYIKDVRIYHNDVGVFLEEWPVEYSKIRVCYRFDQYPAGPEDENARVVELDSIEEYRREEVIVLPQVYSRYYIVVYGVYKDRRHYSAGCGYEYVNEKKRVIYYTLKYSTGLFGGKIKNVSICFYGDDVQLLQPKEFPNITIRKKNQFEPISLTDNSLVVKDIIGGDGLQKKGNEYICTLEGYFTKDDFVKVFCMNLSDEKKFSFETKKLSDYKFQ